MGEDTELRTEEGEVFTPAKVRGVGPIMGIAELASFYVQIREMRGTIAVGDIRESLCWGLPVTANFLELVFFALGVLFRASRITVFLYCKCTTVGRGDFVPHSKGRGRPGEPFGDG